MRRLLAPIVGALLATLVTAGVADAAGDGPIPGKARKAPKAFVQCLRDKGVDVEEERDGDRRRFRLRIDEDDRAAVEACREQAGLPEHGRRIRPDVPHKKLEELERRLEELHACLREHGVDVLAEADVEGPGDVVFKRLPFEDLSEDERAELKEAMGACRGALPPRFDHNT